jgi:hypothetical protein
MAKHKAQTIRHGAAVILGKAGGKAGGPARAAALSPRERSKIASQGGKARQGKG